MTEKFQIGTKYNSLGKYPKLFTVTEILKTYNSKGDLVKVRYVAETPFMGKMLTDHNVCGTTIARGLVG